MFAGCDYIKLKDVGIKKAQKVLEKCDTDDLHEMLYSISKTLKSSKIIVTDEYIERFEAVEAVFRHHRVFDPEYRMQLPLTPYRENQYNYIHRLHAGGEIKGWQKAIAIALGNTDPLSNERYDRYDPRVVNRKYLKDSIWSACFNVRIRYPYAVLPNQIMHFVVTPRPPNPKCPHCGKLFLYTCQMNTHVRKHTGEYLTNVWNVMQGLQI